MKRKLVVCMTAFAMTACILSASAVYADDAEESDVLIFAIFSKCNC